MSVRATDFTAGPGGVMTDEVGVVTGDLTLKTTVDSGGAVTQFVQYQQADEWYRLTGAPDRIPDGGDIEALHTATVTRLARGEN
jgi:hypothetical protein